MILEIEDALVEGSQGMFLWATLQIQYLCGMKTDQAIRKALADLPRDLQEIFRRILHKSGSSDPALQERVLGLVLAACRPLTTKELREALSVTPGDVTWDPSRVLNEVTSALACCGCLLIVDEEEFTVSLVHHSVRQYVLGGGTPDHVFFTLADAQKTMGDIIVTYLGYGVFDTALSETRLRALQVQATPSCIVHATMGSSSVTAQLAQRLLKSRKQPDFDMVKVLAGARSAVSPAPDTSFKFHAYSKAYWPHHIPYASFGDETIFKLARSLFRRHLTELPAMPGEEEGAMLNSVLEIAQAFKTCSATQDESLLVWAIREDSIALIELLSRRPHSDQHEITNVKLLETVLGESDVNVLDGYRNSACLWVAQYLSTKRDMVNLQ